MFEHVVYKYIFVWDHLNSISVEQKDTTKDILWE